MALQRDADHCISNNEREFIVKALREGQRIDGRAPFELRPVRLQFALDDSACTLVLGRTRVLAAVTATLDAPFADRHNEGTLRFNVEFSPMASPAFEPGRPGEDAIEVARLVERGLRESRAVDLEALVVQAGRKVWHLRVDVHVLDHQGGLVDACGLASLAALMAFRRPDVTVGGGDDGQAVTVHAPEVREPVPLSLHHLPLPITFAIFEDGELLVCDPSLKEEAAAQGTFTVTQNAFGELCALQKADGCGLRPPQLMHCIRLATQKVEEQTGHVRKALAAHEVARVQARVRRQPGAAATSAAAAAAGGRSVAVLRSNQLLPQAGGGGGGAAAGAVAMDWDQLPASVRSALQQAEAGGGLQGGADEAGSGSSSSSSEEEEDSESSSGSESGMEEVGQEEAAAADGQRQAEVQAPPQQQQQASAPQQQPKKRRGGGGRDAGLAPRDELAAIGDMIAAAGSGGAGANGGSDLAAAVKKKAKRQAQAQRGSKQR